MPWCWLFTYFAWCNFLPSLIHTSMHSKHVAPCTFVILNEFLFIAWNLIVCLPSSIFPSSHYKVLYIKEHWRLHKKMSFTSDMTHSTKTLKDILRFPLFIDRAVELKWRSGRNFQSHERRYERGKKWEKDREGEKDRKNKKFISYFYFHSEEFYTSCCCLFPKLVILEVV